jgi:hypothetical protein
MMDLQEIEENIQRLQKERQKHLNIELENKIKELSWTKNVTAVLNISPFDAEGLPKYEIHLYGVDFPYYPESICVMGDNPNYQKTIMYSMRSVTRDVPSFYTSCPNILFEFIKKATFKSFDYDDKTLNFLLTIKNIVDNKYV